MILFIFGQIPLMLIFIKTLLHFSLNLTMSFHNKFLSSAIEKLDLQLIRKFISIKIRQSDVK